MAICPRCKVRERYPNQGYCYTCHKEYQRERAKLNIVSNKPCFRCKTGSRKPNSSYCKQCLRDQARENNRINGEAIRKKDKAYRDANPIPWLLANIRRRKAGSLTVAEINQLLADCDYRCLKCGCAERLQFDHIKPIIKGGLTVYDNMQILCSGCNQEKGTQEIDYRKASCK